MLSQRKHSLRLKEFKYYGAYLYFITIATFKKHNYFIDGSTVNLILPILSATSASNGFKIIVYCFMPDHLHLLIAGSDNSSLPEFIKIFKQKSGYLYRKIQHRQLWQRSYYDHVLRKEENVGGIARYILHNPVRKDLVDDYKHYEFCGSSVINVRQDDL
jgi:putative transposase